MANALLVFKKNMGKAEELAAAESPSRPPEWSEPVELSRSATISMHRQ